MQARLAAGTKVCAVLACIRRLAPNNALQTRILRCSHAACPRLCRSGSSHAVLQSIRELPAEPPMYVVIHNIEGSGALARPGAAHRAESSTVSNQRDLLVSFLPIHLLS